jgi:hypothetical protein
MGAPGELVNGKVADLVDWQDSQVAGLDCVESG